MDSLVGATVAVPSTHRGNTAGAHLQRERLYARVVERPVPGISHRDIDQHFATMPARYWDRVTKAELIWGLETVQSFLQKAGASATPRSTAIADARYYPERGFAKVMICSWDRPGLLAKIAAGFSALRVNIQRAEVYTRSDGLALDLFEVTDLDHSTVPSAERLEQLTFLIEGALSDPPRFVSVWASQFHRLIAPAQETRLAIHFDNEYSPEHTVIRVQATDRLGLLHDLLRALAQSGLNLVEALVETDETLATDAFYVTDLKGGKILDSARLERLRKSLTDAVKVQEP